MPSKYKVVVTYPNGETDEEVFDTEEEAHHHGQMTVENSDAGAEVLHMHNPGDYPDPEDDDGADYEVIEVDA